LGAIYFFLKKMNRNVVLLTCKIAHAGPSDKEQDDASED
jgi:hypothetical protein